MKIGLPNVIARHQPRDLLMNVSFKAPWQDPDDAKRFDVLRTQLFSAVLGDLLDQLGYQQQFLPQAIKPIEPHRVLVGRAMTVLEIDLDGATATDSQPFGKMFEALDDLKPHEIYVASGSSLAYALWGGLMTTRAKKLGAAGAVLHGYHRDTQEIVQSQWPVFSMGSYAQDQAPRGKVADWRVARTIFVADDDKTAERYAFSGANNPYEFYWSQMLFKMKRGKRAYVFKKHKDQPDDEVTLEHVMKHCVIHGSVNKVVDQLLALRQEIGDFGEIVYAGMDWVDPALGKRSMQLMAEQVMPRVNAAIGKSAAA